MGSVRDMQSLRGVDMEPMIYSRSRFACGDILIGGITPKIGASIMCPEHGETTVVEVETGTIEAYIGFVPTPKPSGV